MKFIDGLNSPLKFYIYCERYVNDGSPSGFTNLNEVSCKYRPHKHKNFKLPIFTIRREDVVLTGKAKDICLFDKTDSDHLPIPVHPDIYHEAKRRQRFELSNKKPEYFVDVIPTATGRTVLTEPTNGMNIQFIKLHYPKILGRFTRDLPLFKWIAAKETMQTLNSYKDRLPKYIKIFDDVVYMFVKNGFLDEKGFGVIFRNFPSKFLFESETIIIPYFSLFAENQKNKATVLESIIDYYQYDINEVMNKIVFPLISAFVFFALDIGLIPECNAQNVVLKIDKEGYTTIAFRDMENFWKDLSILNKVHHNVLYTDYHTIDDCNHKDFFERRSFLYDFKLGEYILYPLSVVIVKKFNKTLNEVDSLIKEFGQNCWKGNENYFSSSMTWYSYPNDLNVSRNRYLEKSDPKYR